MSVFVGRRGGTFSRDTLPTVSDFFCTPMNFPRNDLLNEGQTTKEMIKFGLIIGLVAAIVACVAVVVTDRTDTRLRDYEDIPRKFNLPVLGVVPRIETLVQEDKTNNKNIRKGAEK